MTSDTLKMSKFASVKDLKKEQARLWINANVWDGEDRAGCKGDMASFDPDELQELINDLVAVLYS